MAAAPVGIRSAAPASVVGATAAGGRGRAPGTATPVWAAATGTSRTRTGSAVPLSRAPGAIRVTPVARTPWAKLHSMLATVAPATGPSQDAGMAT